MSLYLDIYFLSNHRSIETVKAFVHEYSPQYEESAVDYPIPIYSDNPTKIFNNLFELFDFLEKNTNYDYIVYLRNLDDKSSIKHVILQFTNDGKIIVGVSVKESDFTDAEIDGLFYKLKQSVSANIGYITVEEPPPSNSDEFLDLSQSRYVPADI